jgi:hypothetical protein
MPAFLRFASHDTQHVSFKIDVTSKKSFSQKISHIYGLVFMALRSLIFVLRKPQGSMDNNNGYFAYGQMHGCTHVCRNT